MEMYKCEHCGAFFDESAISSHYEYRGECFGDPSYELVSTVICPECGAIDEYDETEECGICGNSYVWDETSSTICPDCMAKYSNIDSCYEVGKECKEDVEINGFLVSMFSKEAIEEILLRELKRANEITPINCSSFIENDPWWFGDKIIEEVKKNEDIEV